MINRPFFESIHKRGLNLTMLAKAAGCGRVHLTEVLNGKRSGVRTWPKLRDVLTAEELEMAEEHAGRSADMKSRNDKRSGGSPLP